MKRLTSNNYFEMDERQLALNQAYIGEDGRAWYVETPEEELSVCDLIRGAAEALGAELPVLGDEDLSELMAEWLAYGDDEPEGVLAILYRTLCAAAELRARLFRYEDAGLEPEAVRRLASLEVNAPLTQEELCEMTREPVWIQRQLSALSGWEVIRTIPNADREVEFTDGLRLPLDRRGKTWTPYRRRPEAASGHGIC